MRRQARSKTFKEIQLQEAEKGMAKTKRGSDECAVVSAANLCLLRYLEENLIKNTAVFKMLC